MAARIAYAVWLSPYEIVADEAQYWDWSRHLDWSYFEHGPGIAWVIAAATSAFGSSLWALRAPSAVFGAVMMIAIAGLARDGNAGGQASGRQVDVALASMLLVCLIPAFQVTFLLMTPDAPYLACWAIAAWAGWRALRGELEGRPVTAAWIAAASGVGAALLFNYAAVMLIVSFAGFMWAAGRRLSWRRAAGRIALAAIVVLAWIVPIVVWNIQHGGAAFSHMRGYLALPGGIWPARPVWAFNPIWTAAYVGGTLAIIGPSIVLMGIASRGARDDRERWLVWCAAPLLTVFLLVSVRTRIEGNWPLPAFVTLVALVAPMIVEMRGAGRVERWGRAALVYGLVAAILIHAPMMTARVPVFGRFVPVERFSGTAAAAARVAPIVKSFRESAGPDSLIVAASHNDAGRLSFYLPGHPIVRSAGRFFGKRPSSYDFFPDTALTSTSAQGKPALLIGETPERWRAAFELEGFELVDPPSVSRVARFKVR